MSSERTPLNPRSSLRVGQVQHSLSDREFSSSVDEDESGFILLHRRTVYCLLGYALLASILALAFLLALVLSGTDRHDAGRAEREQQPMEHVHPSPPAMPTDPSSPSLHGPLPARPNWNKSHLAHILVLTDIHFEPHYNPTAPNSRYGVCRDDTHLLGCLATDWEGASSHSYSTASSSSSFYYGRYMCDPPHSLVSSALHSLATTLAPVPLDAILLPGDLAAHFIACPRTMHSAINRTLELVSTAFPSTPVIFSIGNTDIFPTSSLPPLNSEPAAVDTAALANGSSDCTTAFSTLLDLLLLHGMLDERDDAASIRTFCHGGYYSKPINNGRIRILSLNTIAWSLQLLDTSQANLGQPTTTTQPSNLTPASSPCRVSSVRRIRMASSRGWRMRYDWRMREGRVCGCSGTFHPV